MYSETVQCVQCVTVYSVTVYSVTVYSTYCAVTMRSGNSFETKSPEPSARSVALSKTATRPMKSSVEIERRTTSTSNE